MDGRVVSIIIPVYNVRNYLKKCLDSVAAQTYHDLEVVIVNDGSTDDSLEIVQHYVTQHSHFQCHSIENRGLGGARNYGMEKATGDYFFFLDSDDYIAPDCIEKLMAAAMADGSDIVVCNCYDVTEDGTVIYAYRNQYQKRIVSLCEEPEILFNRVSAWGKLYKKELFHNLQYVSREWYEDMRMTPKLYLGAGKISYIEDSLLYYVQRTGSIMNSGNYKRNLEIITAFQDLLSYYKKQGVYEQYRFALEFLVIEHVAVAAISRVAMGDAKENREILQQLQDYLSEFEGLFRNPYLKSQRINRKIILWLNRHKGYALTKLLMRTRQLLKK